MASAEHISSSHGGGCGDLLRSSGLLRSGGLLHSGLHLHSGLRDGDFRHRDGEPQQRMLRQSQASKLERQTVFWVRSK